MCGLFGILLFNDDRTPCENKLAQSISSLNHRGPDAQVTFSMSAIGMAHARLSLVDIHERSNQPMWDPSRRYAILFNGEIYNFQELRTELVAKGYQFSTSSDTEVLLNALIAYAPEDILPRLNGMFGFVFFDTQERTALLARDRFGMKPLFYHHGADFFAVSSEIKAFAPWLSLRPNQMMLSSYLLRFGGPTRGESFYEGVRSLSPGEMIKVSRNGQIERDWFFRLPHFIDDNRREELASISKLQVVDEMDRLITNSVAAHMFADAPVGAFCSGGVDSSLLMAKATKVHNNLAIFHANVKGQWSEHHAAEELANHLKLDLLSVDVEDQDFVDLLPRVMKHYEYPFTYHPNCAPLMMVAQLARDAGVKGLLSGEGSDECFLGYPWLGRKALVDVYRNGLTALRKAVHKIPEVGQILWPHETHNVEEVRSLLNGLEIDDDERYVREYAARASSTKLPRESIWTLDYMHHHLRTLLHRNDTMGMAASIEARFPLLDLEVVRAAVNLPPQYKLRKSLRALDKAHPFIQDKWVVREVAARYIPRTLSHRKKLGFWTTVFKRLDISPAYFKDSYVSNLFGLQPGQIETVLAHGQGDLAVRLLHIDVWGDVCLDGKSEDQVVSKLRQHVRIRPE